MEDFVICVVVVLLLSSVTVFARIFVQYIHYLLKIRRQIQRIREMPVYPDLAVTANTARCYTLSRGRWQELHLGQDVAILKRMHQGRKKFKGYNILNRWLFTEIAEFVREFELEEGLFNIYKKPIESLSWGDVFNEHIIDLARPEEDKRLLGYEHYYREGISLIYELEENESDETIQ